MKAQVSDHRVCGHGRSVTSDNKALDTEPRIGRALTWKLYLPRPGQRRRYPRTYGIL